MLYIYVHRHVLNTTREIWVKYGQEILNIKPMVITIKQTCEPFVYYLSTSILTSCLHTTLQLLSSVIKCPKQRPCASLRITELTGSLKSIWLKDNVSSNRLTATHQYRTSDWQILAYHVWLVNKNDVITGTDRREEII